jgi:hypothetical protein
MCRNGWRVADERTGVARRRQPSAPVVELPEHLRRDAVSVEQFVPWDEPVSSVGEDPPYPTYRRLLSWRRWQDAVIAWGAGRGPGRAAAARSGLVPGSTAAVRGYVPANGATVLLAAGQGCRAIGQ